VRNAPSNAFNHDIGGHEAERHGLSRASARGYPKVAAAKLGGQDGGLDGG
jgi:hypothetical protein